MKSFSFNAHNKPITDIKYSKESDLLFVASKDKYITAWYTKTGKMLGSYECDAAINRISINSDCTKLMAGCSDTVLYIFDIMTGKKISEIRHPTLVLDVSYSIDDEYFLSVTGKQFRRTPSIQIFKTQKNNNFSKRTGCEPYVIIEKKTDAYFTRAIWDVNNRIIAGMSDGTVIMYDKNGKELMSTKDHGDKISDIQMFRNHGLFITSSHDKTANLYETDTFQIKKTYKHSDIINTVTLSPIKYHIALGGGCASIATTTDSNKTYNDINFYHMIFESEIGAIRGHFSPINIIKFSPNGYFLASGGEDGIIKLFQLDNNYLKMDDSVKSI